MKLARPIEEIPCSEMNIQKGDEVSDWRAQNKTRIMPTKTFGKRMKEQKERGTRIAHNHTRTHTHTEKASRRTDMEQRPDNKDSLHQTTARRCVIWLAKRKKLTKNEKRPIFLVNKKLSVVELGIRT